jgi:predicted amidohydrolase YtcJ
MQAATLLFHNGPVLTQDKRGPVSDALAVVGDRIAALGDDAKAMRGPQTQVVDLAGRALIPGFVDAHNHFVSFGLRTMRLDLSSARNKDDLLQSLVERAKMTPPDGWVVGHSLRHPTSTPRPPAVGSSCNASTGTAASSAAPRRRRPDCPRAASSSRRTTRRSSTSRSPRWRRS